MTPLVKRSLALAVVAVFAAALYTLFFFGAFDTPVELSFALLKLFLFPPILLGTLTVFGLTFLLARKADRNGRKHHPYARGFYVGIATHAGACLVGGTANVIWFQVFDLNARVGSIVESATPPLMILVAGLIPAALFGLAEGWLIKTYASPRSRD